jgi:protein ImuB
MIACVLLVRWADTVADPVMALLAVAQRFSPRVAWVEPHAIAIDLHGLARLFGEPRAIGEELRRALAQAQLETHIAIAGTRTAARLLAHARAGLTVIDPPSRPGRFGEAEAAALAPLPLALLDSLAFGAGAAEPAAPRAAARFYRTSPMQELVKPARRSRKPATPIADRLRLFRQWGLRTLGDLAALPPGELAARLGADGPALQALARGIDPAPLTPLVEDERFEASLELEWPIEGLEPLSFVLGRLCEPVCERLDKRGRAAAELHLDLTLVTRAVWARKLELPAPMKDPRTFRTLLLLDLESNPPPAAIDVVSLRVEPTPAPTLQHSLLERARPRPEQISTLVARLSALVGARRIGRPVLLDTHRPDAFEMAAFTEGDVTRRDGAPHREDAKARSREEDDASVLSPVLRRYRPPIPARVETGEGRPTHLRASRPGVAGGAVTLAAGPWRSSGEWWAIETTWDRDEWDVALPGGVVCRLFRDRRQDRWYIEGVYD